MQIVRWRTCTTRCIITRGTCEIAPTWRGSWSMPSWARSRTTAPLAGVSARPTWSVEWTPATTTSGSPTTRTTANSSGGWWIISFTGRPHNNTDEIQGCFLYLQPELNCENFLNRIHPWQVNPRGRSPTVTGASTSFPTRPHTRYTSPVWSSWLWLCLAKTWETLCSMWCSRGQRSSAALITNEIHIHSHVVCWIMGLVCVLQPAAGSPWEHHSLDERDRTGHHCSPCTDTVSFCLICFCQAYLLLVILLNKVRSCI